MSTSPVRVAIQGHVATVRLNRPSVGNAVNEALAFEFRDALTELSQSDDVRVVVVTGEGTDFCAGTELPNALSRDVLPHTLAGLRIAGAVAALTKPVLAAVNGEATDQGLELALACDIRVASTGARFGLTQVQAGLVPWDGGTQRLPRLVGRGRALEMVLTSRRVGAEEALAMGLVNKVVELEELLESTLKIAQTIAAHGPIAAGYLKEAVLKGMDMTLEQGLHLEADLNILLQTTTDRVEGIQSFTQRRKPDYSGE
ncbi:MAG: enoyl-CoA hydratase/isomerase family protein [Chloroflexi bacterium]|nr:enoyl-CoA hydratase/isomerase family protein [Chloroflexota bacterium]